jgi:hypothetical protein
MRSIADEWLERLTANVEVATVLGFIPASSPTQRNLWAADDAVLNKVLKNKKGPPVKEKKTTDYRREEEAERERREEEELARQRDQTRQDPLHNPKTKQQIESKGKTCSTRNTGNKLRSINYSSSACMPIGYCLRRIR